MNSFFQASEAGEIPHEGLTTLGTTFTSPWMDKTSSPDTCFVNTMTQTSLPVMNAEKGPDSTFISTSMQDMSPTDKVDCWTAPTPARPSQSSTLRPSTRNMALTSLAGDQRQLSNQNTGNAFIDPSTGGSSTRDLFLHSFVDEQGQLPDGQMDTSITTPSSLEINRSKSSASHSGTRDPFFDSVPKGPSQFSTSLGNVGPPTFDSRNSSGDQAPASPSDNTDTSVVRAERIQENCHPQLTLDIPNTSIGSDTFLCASQMATHSEIPDSQADAPHTTDSSIPSTRLSISSFQRPQQQASRRANMLNPAARTFQSKYSSPRARAPRTNHTVMQPTVVSHSNSRTWTSNMVVEKERWKRVEESLRRMHLLKSSIVPKTLKGWLAHQEGCAGAKKERELRKLNDMNPSLRDPRLPPSGRPAEIGAAFRGRVFKPKNYSSVLGIESVWAHKYSPPAERPDPLWPCAEEMKEEGDERNTSGFRRFPALPRIPGNNTVHYKLKKIEDFLKFDAIGKLPTRESVEAANEKLSSEETEKMEGYLGRSLLDALDCITEDSF